MSAAADALAQRPRAAHPVRFMDYEFRRRMESIAVMVELKPYFGGLCVPPGDRARRA